MMNEIRTKSFGFCAWLRLRGGKSRWDNADKMWKVIIDMPFKEAIERYQVSPERAFDTEIQQLKIEKHTP